jgi:hypothetical protein
MNPLVALVREMQRNIKKNPPPNVVNHIDKKDWLQTKNETKARHACCWGCSCTNPMDIISKYRKTVTLGKVSI